MKFVEMNDERKAYKRPQMREINVESESIMAASPDPGKTEVGGEDIDTDW